MVNETKGAFLVGEVRDNNLLATWTMGSWAGIWFGSGNTTGTSPGINSLVDRLFFNFDTTVAVAKGFLSASRYMHGASGSYTDAWYGGGSNSTVAGVAVATVDRIIFASDSATAVAKGPLSLARIGISSSSDATTNAWYGGGGTGYPGTTGNTLVDRIIFSSDTVAAVAKGPLSLARDWTASSGNLTDAWWAGGAIVSGPYIAYSTIDRVIFAADIAFAVAKGSLPATAPSTGTYRLAACSNTTDAWFGGGASLGPLPSPGVSTVNRIIFASDTAAAVAKGTLVLARLDLAGGDNRSTDGWFGGGVNTNTGSGSFSAVDRIIFANDTIRANQKGPLTLARATTAN